MKIETTGATLPAFIATLLLFSQIIGQIWLFCFFDCHVTFCLQAIHFADIEFLLSAIFIQ
jgi:hypothetical protein